jgi:hypothetical protein
MLAAVAALGVSAEAMRSWLSKDRASWHRSETSFVSSITGDCPHYVADSQSKLDLPRLTLGSCRSLYEWRVTRPEAVASSQKAVSGPRRAVRKRSRWARCEAGFANDDGPDTKARTKRCGRGSFNPPRCNLHSRASDTVSCKGTGACKDCSCRFSPSRPCREAHCSRKI